MRFLTNQTSALFSFTESSGSDVVLKLVRKFIAGGRDVPEIETSRSRDLSMVSPRRYV